MIREEESGELVREQMSRSLVVKIERHFITCVKGMSLFKRMNTDRRYVTKDMPILQQSNS